MDKLVMLYIFLIAIFFLLVLKLNNRIYNNRWFVFFIPISIIMIIVGFLVKEIFVVHFYKLLIVPPILVYFVKLLQTCFGFFDQKYTVNIRGFEDKATNGLPSMDTLFTFVLLGIYFLMFVIVR